MACYMRWMGSESRGPGYERSMEAAEDLGDVPYWLANARQEGLRRNRELWTSKGCFLVSAEFYRLLMDYWDRAGYQSLGDLTLCGVPIRVREAK